MTSSDTLKQAEQEVQHLTPIFLRLREEFNRTIVGQQKMADALLIALISGGHVLLEGVPGLAKTTAVKSLAQSVNLQFKRIQFTPDLLPSDLVGTEIFEPRTGSFRIRKGPVFAQIILADEINRAPAKVQAALLEVMEERQVSIAGETFKMDEPFMVLATQNPIEQEGTYRLPEAQVDRFLLKVLLTYPTKEEELEILKRVQHGMPTVSRVAGQEELIRARELAKKLYVDPRVEEFIVRIVDCTRHPDQYEAARLKPFIEFGASPRATLGLSIAARSKAILQGRAFVTPQDVKDVALEVMRHRIMPTYEAEAEGVDTDWLVAEILRTVIVPRPVAVDRTILRRVHTLSLRTRRQAGGQLLGGYRSTIKGQGLEYEESRVYEPGDEIRHLDWKVTARKGVPHTKRYSEERQLRLLISVDVSDAMRFGGSRRTKLNTALTGAALFAYAAVREGDTVEVMLESERDSRHFGPLRREKTFWQMLGEIETIPLSPYLQAGGRFSFAALGEKVRKVRRHPQVWIHFSDYQATDLDSTAMKSAVRNLDFYPVQVASQLELSPVKRIFPRWSWGTPGVPVRSTILGRPAALLDDEGDILAQLSAYLQRMARRYA